MNKLKISILTLAISLITLSCADSTDISNTDVDTTNVEVSIEGKTIANNVNADEFEALIQKGALLIDVRTPGEVDNGAIDGYTNINFSSSSFQSEIEKLDKNEPVLVYCASGGRSGKTMNMMKDMGFKEVYNLNGGYNGWPNK
jgi:rhodanese-related sulfurtransferase